jgi:hypothetical protein
MNRRRRETNSTDKKIDADFDMTAPPFADALKYYTRPDAASNDDVKRVLVQPICAHPSFYGSFARSNAADTAGSGVPALDPIATFVRSKMPAEIGCSRDDSRPPCYPVERESRLVKAKRHRARNRRPAKIRVFHRAFATRN